MRSGRSYVAQLPQAHDDSCLDLREEVRLAALEPLGDEVRRKDEQVAGLPANGDLGAVLVGYHGPLEAEGVDERLAERKADSVDVGVRVVSLLAWRRSPFPEPGRKHLVEQARVGKCVALLAGVDRCEALRDVEVRADPRQLGVVRSLDR